MTAHEAAADILREAGRPLSSKEVARRALAKGLVRSNAQSPEDSIAQTIEKNIRGQVYNRPQLVFVPSVSGRLIGLPGQQDRAAQPEKLAPSESRQAEPRFIAEDEQWEVALPARVVNKLDLCVLVGFGASREEVAAEMLARGLAAASEDIAARTKEYFRAQRGNTAENTHPETLS